jgi:hypothetical protein
VIILKSVNVVHNDRELVELPGNDSGVPVPFPAEHLVSQDDDFAPALQTPLDVGDDIAVGSRHRFADSIRLGRLATEKRGRISFGELNLKKRNNGNVLQCVSQILNFLVRHADKMAAL